MPSVLALGLDPKFADDSQMPGLTPELIGAFIDTQLGRLRDAGYEVDSCLVDTGESADVTLVRRLASKHYDCVMIGAGLRDTAQLRLFERLINTVHRMAPDAKLCFNTRPGDTLEAVRRRV
jgi:hypothetical protein